MTHVHRLIVVLFILTSRPILGATTMRLEVDARDLPRRLLHSSLTLPAEGGKEITMWYPKWVPGVHAPAGPIQNVAGIRMFGADDEPIDWRRDDEELLQLYAAVPTGTDQLRIELDYITNQPSVNSRGVDSYGNALLGVISWNTVLMYPEGKSNEDITVQLKLRLPDGWRYGTSLKTESVDGGWITFESASLRELIDSPLICGQYFRTVELTPRDGWPAYLHLTSESMSAIQIDDALIDNYRRLIDEATKLFGWAPFEEYHFLVVCSDTISRMGLEHLNSSLNGVGERGLIDEEKRKLWPAYLLPHEFVHAWCGKYRRPVGMATREYHSPKHTRHLWIYEGLTQYLGEVLTVRCGLLDLDEYRQRLAGKISWHMRNAGRRWRSLEDTAVAAYSLRGHSRSWPLLRRSQDYYNEGLLLWMEADAIIREQSDNRHSLDNFCQRFLGKSSTRTAVLPYELDEVVAVLSELADYDWEGFLHARVGQTQTALPLEVVERVGYRLQYANTPSDYLKQREESWKRVDMGDSIGASFNNEGEVRAVVPDGSADEAGLAPGMKVVGVNGRKFSTQRIKDGIAASPVKRTVELLVLSGDTYQTIRISYADGPKYLELVRDENRPNALADIFGAKPSEPTKAAAGK